MSRIEGHLPRILAPSPCRVPPPPKCPAPGLHEHRLAERPVLVGLLEHLPGDVPFSTHLELENARARLVDRAADEPSAPTRMHKGEHAERPQTDASTTCTEPPKGAESPTRPARSRSRDAERVQEIYTQRQARWPLGGLIDLVI